VRRIVRATHAEGGEIDWAKNDLSIELSKKGDGRTAYVGTFAAKARNPASTVTISSCAGSSYPLIRR
jgi:hypothetical protein